ncbi:MAG TPA: DUF2200 domain-containing protein [Micrococcales bacterium]|uniref:DUF2200 domain-containing protein n=1 Tax=Miniimonas arenae TaxID=676201 RepID=UPI000EE2101E|nr:DUF2200 domain-containing protein [Miniimonas arenae]HCX85746.1 DUF2200 domain-containing protein [Micrococcales bacterium]
MTSQPAGSTSEHRIFGMPFARIYPLYVAKVERKGRTRAEVDTVIEWLTGYGEAGLAQVLADGTDVRGFFDRAPRINPDAALVTGVICGMRVEEIEDPLMRRVRQLDKLVDEIAKGRPMAKILRGSSAALP